MPFVKMAGRSLQNYGKGPNNQAGNPQQLLGRGEARLLGPLSNSLALNGSSPRLHLLRTPPPPPPQALVEA